MRKIQSLFKRDYEGTRLVYDEVAPGAEWVAAGEGVPTIKLDGTSCMIKGGRLFKRYDRKLNKSAMRRKRNDEDYTPAETDFKPAPDGWIAAEDSPDPNTGHWPGWLPVGDGPEDAWHREAALPHKDGTYELVGPKVQGNPYGLTGHELRRHGIAYAGATQPPRTFDGLREWLAQHELEGIVWHHPDGRMVKIKRRDFGLEWPLERRSEVM